ncbi:MAG: phosphodiester glycosidase family protein [Anaerolineae bacterium]|nr:MAG: phosphodiester glycosidase family protein [Anaerolineae bacterium]
MNPAAPGGGYNAVWPTMKPRTRISLLTAALLIVSLACDLSIPRAILAQQPEPTTETLFKGVTYERRVTQSPRPMVIHIVTINLQADGIKPFVTPPDNPGEERAVNARTTAEFLEDFDLQLAINGDAFRPWHDYGPMGYEPDAGDPVDPLGLAAHNGEVYSESTSQEIPLHILRTNRVVVGGEVGRVHMTLSGNRLLVNNGSAQPDLGNTPQPRTAVGVNPSGNTLILIVVDGRQDGYSEGMTLTELAALFVELKAYDAVNLDGGGSSTLVVQGSDGQPRVLNSPIHGGLPGNLRPVANHLGFYASKD